MGSQPWIVDFLLWTTTVAVIGVVAFSIHTIRETRRMRKEPPEEDNALQPKD